MPFTKPTNATTDNYPQQFGRLVDVVEGPALRNFIRNGDFQIAQRGTSFAGITTSQYTLDGWQSGFAGTQTVTQQAHTVGQTSVPNNPKFFIRVVRSVAAAVFNGVLLQPIEFPDRLSGKTVTVSFYARLASGTKTLGVHLQNSGGITWAGDPVAQSINLTTAWTLYALTFTLNAMTAVTTSAALNLLISENTPFGTFTLDVSDVQLELGSEATYFERLNHGEQMRWALRYFWRIEGVADIAHFATGSYYSTTLFMCGFMFPVPMRIAPTLSISAAADITVEVAGASRASTAVSITRANTMNGRLDITTAADTAGRAGVAGMNANKWLALSAEL